MDEIYKVLISKYNCYPIVLDSNNPLPDKLISRDDEKQLFICLEYYRNINDKVKVENLETILINHNQKLVSGLSKKFFSGFFDHKLAISEINLIILRCIRCFDYNFNYRFSTYFVNSCYRNKGRIIQAVVKGRRTQLFSDKLDKGWKIFRRIDETATDPKDCLIKTETEEELVSIVKKNFPNEFHKIFCLYFGLLGIKQKTKFQIAKMFGVCHKEIEKRIRLIKCKLEKIVFSVN